MLIFLIITIVLSLVVCVDAKTGEDCCPGIALEPVSPETCISGAENNTMCVGNFLMDCACVNGEYELEGFIYCGQCQSSMSIGGIIIILIAIFTCVICCSILYFCCRRKRKSKFKELDKVKLFDADTCRASVHVKVVTFDPHSNVRSYNSNISSNVDISDKLVILEEQ